MSRPPRSGLRPCALVLAEPTSAPTLSIALRDRSEQTHVLSLDPSEAWDAHASRVLRRVTRLRESSFSLERVTCVVSTSEAFGWGPRLRLLRRVCSELRSGGQLVLVACAKVRSEVLRCLDALRRWVAPNVTLSAEFTDAPALLIAGSAEPAGRRAPALSHSIALAS